MCSFLKIRPPRAMLINLYQIIILTDPPSIIIRAEINYLNRKD